MSQTWSESQHSGVDELKSLGDRGALEILMFPSPLRAFNGGGGNFIEGREGGRGVQYF